MFLWVCVATALDMTRSVSSGPSLGGAAAACSCALHVACCTMLADARSCRAPAACGPQIYVYICGYAGTCSLLEITTSSRLGAHTLQMRQHAAIQAHLPRAAARLGAGARAGHRLGSYLGDGSQAVRLCHLRACVWRRRVLFCEARPCGMWAMAFMM